MNIYPLSKAYKLLVAIALPLIICSSNLAATEEHAYQVTGPVTTVTGTSITVQKGAHPWVILMDANTKKTTANMTDLKGTKVTVKYYMVAEVIASKTLPKK